MGMHFRNWLEEGYYEEDEFGDLSKIEDPYHIHKIQSEDKLYYHDGLGMTKVSISEDINLKTE